MDKMVIIEDLRKSFGALEVLKGISLSIDRGEVLALVGRSGSGKSTLLRCLNGLEDASGGTIEIAGHTVPFCVLLRISAIGSVRVRSVLIFGDSLSREDLCALRRCLRLQG